MNTKESLARLKTIITDLTSFYGELSEELYKLHFVKDGVSDTEKIIPFPIKENGNTLQGENMLTVSKFNIRRRQHKNSIEARCNYAGRSISISAPTEKELKSKLKKYCEDFNKKLKLAVAPAPMKQEQTEKGVVLPGFGTSGDVSFKEYALQYLEQVKKDDVSYDWYLKQLRKLELYVFPLIGTARFEQISIFDCNAILREIRAQGHERTAEDVHNLLDQIFSYAELDGLRKNPMKRIKFVRHERKNGRCLTFQEEKTLIEISRGTPYFRAVVLMLYCGLRLCECASAKVYDEDDRFIWALNSKRSKAHNKFTFKLIPITPMMKPYVELIHCTQEVQAHSIGNFISEKMGNGITSRFLRHTFNTRLAKFMIAPEFREFAMGHVSSSVNADTYTHYLEIKDTYFSEFQRVDYALELSPTSSPT